MQSLTSFAYNLVFRLMPQDKPGQAHDYPAERAFNDRNPSRKPRGVTVKYLWLGGHSAERIEKKGNTKGWVLYIHGGGFTTGSARERRNLCQYLAACHGYNCISINYRLAPENRWPAQIEDCLAAWKDFLALGYSAKDVVLMGESAGGTLVLSLALYLKRLGMEQPKAVVSFSPVVSQTEHYPSHAANAKTDYMLRDSVMKGMQEPVFGKDATEMILRDPLASPIYGDWTNAAPVFLSASDTEALLDDSRMLYQKLKNEGHRTGLDLQHRCCHAFQVFPGMPEARRAIGNALAFVEECD